MYVKVWHANISGHFTKYFSNEVSQPQDLPIDQIETEPTRVDIGSPNVNNAVSPDADNSHCRYGTRNHSNERVENFVRRSYKYPILFRTGVICLSLIIAFWMIVVFYYFYCRRLFAAFVIYISGFCFIIDYFRRLSLVYHGTFDSWIFIKWFQIEIMLNK